MTLYIIALYLVVGMGVLILFDLITGRLRRNFRQCTTDAQSRLTNSGNYIGDKWAAVLFFGAMWLFWPFVLIGAIADRIGGKNGKRLQNGSQKSDRPS